MFGRLIGSTVSVSFGLVFLMLSSSRLPEVVALAVRAVGILAVVGFVAAAWTQRHTIFGGRPATAGHSTSAARGPAADRPFGGHYWTIVAIEVVALFGGLQILARVFGLGDAGVAWVAIVVGAHFLPMAAVTGERFFTVIAATMTPAGIIGLILAFAGAPLVAVDVVAGLVSGTVLLAAGWWGMTRIIEAGRSAGTGGLVSGRDGLTQPATRRRRDGDATTALAVGA